MMMTWKGFGRSDGGLILRYYPSSRLEELRKTTTTSVRIASIQGRESKPGPPEYEVGVSYVYRTNFRLLFM
jgi:hypothetical protein